MLAFRAYTLPIAVLCLGQLQLIRSCGGDFRFSESYEEKVISSPGYPSQSYPPGTDCVWNVEVLDYHDIQVTTDVAQFRGTPSSDCSSSDRLEFRTPTNMVLGNVCSSSNNVKKIEKSKFSVRFRTNAAFSSSGRTNGFSIRLKAVPYYELQCFPERFSLQLPVTKIDIPSRYPYENYQLLDSRCKAFITTGSMTSNGIDTIQQHNKSQVQIFGNIRQTSQFLSFSSGYGNCGTTFASGAFTNTVLMIPKPITGATRPTRRLPFACRLAATDRVVSQSYIIDHFSRRNAKSFGINSTQTRAGSINGNGEMILLNGEIQLDVNINVYNNDEFHPDGQPNPWESHKIYFELTALSAPLQVIVAAKKCWISATSNPEDPNSYLFMNNGCPYTDDLIERHPSSNHNDRFSIASIELPGAGNTYYVHCQFAVCSTSDPQAAGNCEKTCITPHLPSGQTGYIIGVIRDAERNHELTSVQVVVKRGPNIIGQTTSTSQGSYRMKLPVGTGYTVTFNTHGYYPATMENIAVSANEENVLETLLQIDLSIVGAAWVSGRINNALTGQPEPYVAMTFRAGIGNVQGTILKTVSTGLDGTWSASLNTGHYTAQLSKDGFTSSIISVTALGGRTMPEQNGVISKIIPPGKTRVVLRWGENPRDLDSHMTGPAGSARFHVYFSSKGSAFSSPFTNLDVDDTLSYGPETITIDEQTKGVYRYSVHDFTNKGSVSSRALADSGAQVQVLRDNEVIKTYNVPNLSGTLWTVFELIGSEFRLVNRMTYAENQEFIM